MDFKLLKHTLTLAFTLLFTLSNAQEFSFLDDTVSIEVGLSDPLETATYVINNSDSSVEFTVVRANNNVPSGWNSCFCIPVCLTDKESSLDMIVEGNDSSMVNIVSAANQIHGEASMIIVLYVKDDSTPLDTCYFFQKTIGSSAVNDPHSLQEKITVYPNPATNEISLKLPDNTTNGYYQIMSLDHKVVAKSRLNVANPLINVSDLPKGNYIIRFEDQNGHVYLNSFIIGE